MSALAEKKINSSHYSLLLLLVFLAILFRSYHEYLLADFPPDKKLQTATAHNFASGNGITIAYASGQDLSETEYKKIGLWPPGFPISLALLMSVGLTAFQAFFVLEVVALSMLFLSLYGIFRLLAEEVLLIIPVCFLLFQAFTISIYKVSFTNDLLSLSFSVCAFFLLLKTTRGNSRWGLLFIFGFISFLPSFYRFSYYPVSLLFPFLLILYALFVDRRRLKAGLFAFFVTCTFVGLQLFYQSTLPTGLSYLNDYYPEGFSGLYWENLALFADLPVEMLTDKYLFRRSLDQIHPALFLVVNSLAWVVFAFTAAALCFRMAVTGKQRGRAYFLTPKNQLLVGGLLVCLVVVCFLALLSLRYPPAVAEWVAGNKWTYVAETRYFGLLLFLFPLLFLIGFQDILKIKWVRIGIMGTGVAFLSFSVGVNLYYTYKYGGNNLKENAAAYYHYSQELESYLKARQASFRSVSLLYAPADGGDGYTLYASLLQIPLLSLKDIEEGINSREPVCILFALSAHQAPEVKDKVEALVAEYQLQVVQEFPDLQLKLYELCVP